MITADEMRKISDAAARRLGLPVPPPKPQPRYGYRPDPGYLYCARCDRLTSELESSQRVFNTGKCACGAELQAKP